MTDQESEYRALRELGPPERRAWLRKHAPADLRGHWWLGLVERAEFDASPRRASPSEQAKENLEFAIELIGMAEEDGMSPCYAASRLALLASAQLKSGRSVIDLYGPIAPDNLCKRIMMTFRLDRGEALAVASRLRATVDEDPPATPESDALRDINWLLPDLEMLVPHISDESVARVVGQWLDVSASLSPV